MEESFLHPCLALRLRDPLGLSLSLESLLGACAQHVVQRGWDGASMGLGLVGSLCWGPQVTADGHGQQLGWGLWTAGLSPELGHQTPTTEPPSQKLCRGRAVALSIIWEGEDEEQEHLYPKAKC